MLALGVVLLGTLLTVVASYATGVSLPDMVGILFGATTNTPALGAAQQTLKQMGINENDQSETFCVVQHLRIDRKPEMAGEDACKKNKSDSQGNSPEMHSSQAQTNGRNQ